MKIKTFSRKTIAIAVAAGVSLGGVQVVSAQAGHDLSGQAVAAESGKLDKSVIKSHSVVSDKSSAAITTEKDTFSDIAGRDAFVDKHGTLVNFDVNMEIPDKAKTGDSIAFKINGAFVPNMKDGNSVDVHAKGNNGEDFVIGSWKYNDADKTVTFTLSKDASDYKERAVHIQVPMRLDPIGIETADKSLEGKAKEQTGTVTLASNGDVLDEFKYSAPYELGISLGNMHIWTRDNTIVNDVSVQHGLDKNRLNPDVNTGTFHGSIKEMRTGQANADLSGVDESNLAVAYDPDATEMRNFTVRYTIDNKNFHFEKGHEPHAWWHRGLDKWKPEERSDGMHYSAYEDAGGLKEALDDGLEYDVKVSDDGRTADLTIKNLAPHNAIDLLDAVDVVGDYTPGDTFKVTGKFIDGVGKPLSAYDYRYTESDTFTYTMPSFDEEGSGVKYEKKAEMTAFVNGKDANDKNSAETITGGKGKFSIDLKNTGTIGASKATVKFPKGVTDKDGKTERVIDLSDGSFAPGKTKKIDLGELNVPNGAQENKFTVEMNGFKNLSDPAWTNTAKTSDSVDPTWGNTEVPDGGTKKIPAGGGAKDAPKGTKYELTGDHPNWITIDGKTGEITAKPPRGTKPGKNQVTVTTTFPDGSTDTDKPVITVTHSDVFIEKVKEVKPDGTVILHRNDGKDISFKVPTGSTVEVNKDGDLVITNPGEEPKTVKLKHTTVTEQGEPGTPDHKIIITDEEGNTHEFGTYDKFLKSIDDNGKGTYTFIMNDGTKLGPIQLGDDITDIKDDGKGNLIVTHKDGSTDTVPLNHTTVTETNKGKPGHTITITTPDGKKISFDAFDTYVTDVKKNAEGDYDIYRSDVDGGKTVWKTIVLSDIRGKISKLEKNLDKLTEKQKADVKNLQNEIDGLEKEIEDLQGVTDDLDNRVSKLEANLTALTLRVTNLEKRVGVLEDTDEAWAKCYAGIGESAVPLALAAPLALMSDMNIPGLAQLNTQIQRTIGIYNPEAAKWMADNRGLFTAATGVLTFAGVVAMLAHTAKECLPYNKTPGVQENMNPIIEGSSKLGEKIESGSSKPEGEAEDNGSSVDAGSSIGDGSSTESGSATGEGSSENE